MAQEEQPHSMLPPTNEAYPANGTQDEQLYSIIRASAIEEPREIYQAKDTTCDDPFYETSCNEGNVPVYEEVKSKAKSPVNGLLLIANPMYGMSNIHGPHVQTGVLNTICSGTDTVSEPVHHSTGSSTSNACSIPPTFDLVFEETTADTSAAMSTNIPDTWDHGALKTKGEMSQATLESKYDIIGAANISRSGTYEGKPRGIPANREYEVMNDEGYRVVLNPVYGRNPVNNGAADYERVQPIGQTEVATYRVVLNPVYDEIPTPVNGRGEDSHKYETVQTVKKMKAATCQVVKNPVYGPNPVNTSDVGYDTVRDFSKIKRATCQAVLNSECVPNSVDTSEGVSEHKTAQPVTNGQMHTAAHPNRMNSGESDTREYETVKMTTESALSKKEYVNAPSGPAATIDDVPSYATVSSQRTAAN